MIPNSSQRRGVLVSAGGGAVGLSLLKAALAARPQSRLRDAPWRLLVSDLIPDAEYRALVRQAPAGVAVERVRRDFRALLAASALSVSQAGYNTVMDVLGTATRAVLVPFADAAETEQMTRAQALQERGWATLVDPATLSPASLAAAMDAALERPPPNPAELNCSGIETTAGIVSACLVGRATSP